MAQWLIVCIALSESSIPRTHTGQFTAIYNSTSRESPRCLTFLSTCIYVHTLTKRCKHIHILIELTL